MEICLIFGNDIQSVKWSTIGWCYQIYLNFKVFRNVNKYIENAISKYHNDL